MIEVHTRAFGTPSGREIARVLRGYFTRQAGEVASRLSARKRTPSLRHWTGPMVKALAPKVAPYLIRGGEDLARKLRKLLRGRARRRRGYFEGFEVKDDPRELFSRLHPRVGQAIERLTFDFCEATNATSVMRIDLALRKLREELLEGLEQGEALRKLTARVRGIFDDPARAYTIARTESNRAVHSGEQIAAEESGVCKKKKWLAKRDACSVCVDLHGKIVGLEEDFAVDSGAGSYAHVPHPPRHPHCTCTVVYLLDED